MSERVVRNVENDYLMCSICLGRYTDPRLLPCGHTFCKQCLDDHIKQTVTARTAGHFTCPNDRTQVARPKRGLAPKDWASAFPVDTFLCSLLSAVMIHGSQDGDEALKRICATHKGRMKEFYCLKCGVTACAYCVIKSHKSDKCECVAIEEAVERLRPKMEYLKSKLREQMQTAQKVQRGEHAGNDTFSRSKEQAMLQLTDLETKLTFFYKTAMKQLEDMKVTTKNTGNKKLTETQQVAMILTNLNETVEKFDDVCNHGSGVEILNMVNKIQEQVKDNDGALNTFLKNSPAMQVHFAVNHDLERVFENAPALGSIVVHGEGSDSINHRPFNSAMSDKPFLATPRRAPISARSVTFSVSHPCRTPRRASEPLPSRPRKSVCVKTSDLSTSCWQLTGVTMIGNHLVVTDAHNGNVLKCDPVSASVVSTLALGCPVCVSKIGDTTDALITLPEKTEMALVATDQTLTLKHSIETLRPYEGIATLADSKFVVSCCVIGKQCLDIIDVSGHVYRTIDKDGSGQALFSWPRFLDTTSAGNILVSDRDQRSVICLDQSGGQKWVFTTTASPWGVSCHDSGSVYLCLDNNEVQVISATGRLVQNKFICGKDGIKVPYAIHARGDSVTVTEWGTSLFAPNSPWVHIFEI